jgi:hypothetical protein
MFGRRRHDETDRILAPGPEAPAPLTTVRVDAPLGERSLGRREIAFDGVRRLFVPSLLIDQTEAMLRRHGVAGEEGIGIWAGSLADGDGFASTLVMPSVTAHGHLHGELSAATMAAVVSRLDDLDLVALAQIHSHPREAYLSSVDEQRPALAVPGFLSIVIPNFGFVDVADVGIWAAYEYKGREDWHELGHAERLERLIVDPSLLVIA